MPTANRCELNCRADHRGPLLIHRLCVYSRGMRAYIGGDYGESVKRLAEWVETGEPADPALAALAQSAVARIGQLAHTDEFVAGDANTLRERIVSLRRERAQVASGSERR